MVGAHSEVQGVTGTQAERVLIGEAGSCAVLRGRDGENGEAVRAQPSEHRQRVGTVGFVQLAGAQLDGKRRGEFGRHPVADGQVFGGLRGEPGLHALCLRLVGQGGDEERGVEIEAQ